MAETPDINAVVAAKLPILNAAASAYNAQRISDTFDKLAAEYAPDAAQTAAAAVVSAVPSSWKRPAEIALAAIVLVGLAAAAAWILKGFGVL